MITFACQSCGKTFAVPESYAGRTARCKSCGAMVTVPAAEAGPGPTAELLGSDRIATAEPPATAPKIPMRLRRLRSDAAEMASAFADPASPIRVTATQGEPPELYRLAYQIRSYERAPGGQPIPRDHHEVEIRLTSEYPRQSPHCRMLTPIFHPNIDPASICVGDHWTAGERLADLAVRIGEMIAYQEYNIKSPLDAEAAMWADLHQAELPTDSRAMGRAAAE